MNTDCCFSRSMSTDMTLVHSSGPNFTVAPGWQAGLLPQPAPYCLHLFGSVSLHRTWSVFSLSFPYIAHYNIALGSLCFLLWFQGERPWLACGSWSPTHSYWKWESPCLLFPGRELQAGMWIFVSHPVLLAKGRFLSNILLCTYNTENTKLKSQKLKNV